MNNEMFLDSYIANVLLENDDESETEWKAGYYRMKINKIKNGINAKGTPYVSISCELDGKYIHVPYYFSELATEKSLEKLVRLCQKKTGGFSYTPKVDLDKLCDSLQGLIGQEVKVEVTQNGEFQNYRIY